MAQANTIASRYRTLTEPWKWVTIILSVLGLALSIYNIFAFRVFDFMLMENSYLYLLMAFYLTMVFIFFPPKKNAEGPGWMILDGFLALVTLAVTVYLSARGMEILERGWGYFAPWNMTTVSVILWVLMLEAVRRTAGPALTIIILFFSLYPLFANHMPGFLEGMSRGADVTANYHVMSLSSLLGIPMKVFGTILIGFVIFGVALQSSGGGNFFLNLSSAILGSTRGGTAKVAVLSSALFGSLSGSVISNVVTTGSITIPAIKRSGYPPHYAGGIECAASTGGVLMPPIMGATAFVMAALLNMSYAEVALAAAIPSVLAYVGLLIQVDGYAGRMGLKGLPKSELPSLIGTLAVGWFYLLAIAVLLFVLFVARRESQAPFYSIPFLLLLAMIRKGTRLNWQGFLDFIQSTGKLLCELVAILAGVGMILGSMSVTGVAAAFAREIVNLAGNALLPMLLLGAVTSFVLGMGMTITACYVFLAIVLAPALIEVGLNVIAVHLYIMYWGMLSYITPPVALAAFPAAVIAGANPIRVGLLAMKLGWVKYIIPLFFVLDPALVWQAPLPHILQSFATTVIGVFFVASVMENYLMGAGNLRLTTPAGVVSSAFLAGGGLVLGLPGWILGWQNQHMDLAGAALVVIGLILVTIRRMIAGKGSAPATA